MSVSSLKPVRVALVGLYDFDNIAVRQLHAHLDREGVAVLSVFLKSLHYNRMGEPTRREMRLALEALGRFRPQVVGLSVRSSFVPVAARLTDMVKRRLGVPVVWGGVHPTVCPDDSLTHADWIVRGEAEEVLLPLVQALARGETPSLPGVWARHRRPAEDLAPPPPDLDRLPAPDFSDDNKLYIENNRIASTAAISAVPFSLAQGSYAIMTGRGCLHHCAFCMNGIQALRPQGIRRRSPALVVEEIRAAREALAIRSVYFHDDIFTCDRAWIEEFAPAYGEQVGLPFVINIHSQFVEPSLMALLRSVGLRTVKMGIQSGSEATNREIFHRPFQPEEVLRAARVFCDLELMAVYDVIIDNPFETDSHRAQTLDLLLRLPQPFNLMMYSLVFFPGYPITERALGAGLIQEDNRTKPLRNWVHKFLKTERDDNAFWNSLFWLAQVPVVPRPWIRRASQSPLLRANPALLKALCLSVHGAYYQRYRSRRVKRQFS